VDETVNVDETANGDETKVATKDNELTLREMSEALPDTPQIMEKVGHCWWHMIYAARGGNWGLAGYYLRRVEKLSSALRVLRPKHAQRLWRFQTQALPDVLEAVEAEDLAALEVAYAAATDTANRLHDESGYPYIKWELPSEAPQGLQLTPVEPLTTVDGHRD
jgi:hypothetical protein